MGHAPTAADLTGHASREQKKGTARLTAAPSSLKSRRRGAEASRRRSHALVQTASPLAPHSSLGATKMAQQGDACFCPHTHTRTRTTPGPGQGHTTSVLAPSSPKKRLRLSEWASFNRLRFGHVHHHQPHHSTHSHLHTHQRTLESRFPMRTESKSRSWRSKCNYPILFRSFSY